MRVRSAVGLLIGLTAVCLTVAWQGLATVAGLLAEAGWGILLVCLFAPPDQLLGSEAWRVLFPRDRRPRVLETLVASWTGSAVNTLLPVATIGGEMVKARIIALMSHSGRDAVSTMVVDKTLQASTVLLWGSIGIAMLAAIAPNDWVVVGVVIGAVLLGLGIAGFIWVQHLGSLSVLARFVDRASGTGKWSALVDDAGETDAAIRAIYRRPTAVAGAVIYRLAGHVWLVGEVLLAAHLMGHTIGLTEAVLLKGVVVAIRAFSFAIPAGLGVQEGGYVAIGILLGMPGELMLAVSLVSRVREMLPRIPFLLVWQHYEGRALWRKREAAREAEPGT